MSKQDWNTDYNKNHDKKSFIRAVIGSPERVKKLLAFQTGLTNSGFFMRKIKREN